MERSLLRYLIQEKLKDNGKKEEENKFPGDETSETHHTIHIDGEPIRYKATAGYMKMMDDHQKLKSRIFYISYERTDLKDRNRQPLTFAFNGGPGASSAWVHFGAMGPKRTTLTDMGELNPPPYEYDTNQHTWLKFTDLVFLDPVGTGYSRHEKDEDPKQFFGVKEDFKWIGDFIRLYITRNNRWLSPKFLAGESYGTFRSVGIADYLQSKHGLDLSGLILVSCALNYQYFDFSPGNDLPYLLFFPAYTATAWYHKKLSKRLQADLMKTLKEVEEWTATEYALALFRGDTLNQNEKQAIAEKMFEYTGVPAGFYEENNLRVSRERFMKQILRSEKKMVGLYDSRFTGIEIDPAGEDIANDPSRFMLFGSHIATLNHYIRNELKYENDIPYAPVSGEVGELWNWQSGKEALGYVNTAVTLRSVMSHNKYLKTMFCCGLYDLCTPYSMSHYTANHLELDPRLNENLFVKDYDAGHMMYINKPSMEKFYQDIQLFISG